MNRILFASALVVFAVVQASASDRIKSTVSIHAGAQGFKPGQTIPVAMLIEVPDGWYTYAENPGDAGMPPDIRLQAPEGVTIGAWRYPPHETFSNEAGTYYGYKERVVLLNEIKMPEAIPSNVAFKGKFNAIWMICKDVCLPFRDTITLTLPQLPGGEALSAPEDWQKLLVSGGWKEKKQSGEHPQK